MRVGFAGTPAFAASALAAIAAAGFDLRLVLTRPDRPQGRGLKLAASKVKNIALERQIPLLQPAALATERARVALFEQPLDVLVVAAYGLILPPAVLAWPRHGCLNIHASRLPRWRGAAPIERAIEAGDDATGITIMQMDAGLDTGPMIDAVTVPIAARETAGTLHDKLASAGALAIVNVLRQLARDETLPLMPQPATGATYACKIRRAEAEIDWRRSAMDIDRLVRAFDPAPGARTSFGDLSVKIRAGPPVARRALARTGAVLEVAADGILVACGEDALRISELQPAGGTWMPAHAFTIGRRVEAGTAFGTSVSST
ncbi:MAG: methionyl-tRNA formyltransferase [Betaproteobacteria bacterium]|nr:methionyl-tRNA formyltransferase [Betaproteobacteria bacterium]